MSCCKRCEEPLPSNYDPRECAFETGTFSESNWNCGTMNALRDITDDLESTLWNDDTNIGVVRSPETDERSSGFIVLRWYKRRGQTDMAYDSDSFQPITLEQAEAAIVAHETAMQVSGGSEKETE